MGGFETRPYGTVDNAFLSSHAAPNGFAITSTKRIDTAPNTSYTPRSRTPHQQNHPTFHHPSHAYPQPNLTKTNLIDPPSLAKAIIEPPSPCPTAPNATGTSQQAATAENAA